MNSTRNRTVVYAIDGNDLLINVGEGWSEFAEQNDGFALLYPESVIGKSIWTFVKGESLRQIYQELIGKVRGKNKTIQFDYRCDSPKLKRFMQMQIVGNLSDESVTFFSDTIRIEAQEFVLHWAAVHRGSQQLKRCSICNLIQAPNQEWLELEVALQQHQMLNSDREIRVVWGVCDTCQRISKF